MNNLERMAKRIVGNDKYPILRRIKIGRGICAWALLPLNMSFWMFPIGLAMQMPLCPTLYAKDKIRNLKESWLLR